MDTQTIHQFNTPEDAVKKLSERIVQINDNCQSQNQRCHMALSGGSTPKLLFQTLSSTYSDEINWNNLHVYWVDDRCVPPDHNESNYGMTKKHLLDLVNIPPENIHRMIGEAMPETEAKRYAHELLTQLPLVKNIPQFDLIILGIGEDGHTASIFPNQMDLLNAATVCAVGIHPVSDQKRITLTGKTICQAKEVVFLVTGSGKAAVISEIFNKTELATTYPAAHINLAKWYLDGAAAKLISTKESCD
jgi:6-phosphogluconolactonase